MSLKEQQDFLARLFIDESLRQNFLENPAKTGAENALQEIEIAGLQAVLPAQIKFFAESLFWKRLRETEKFLPLTRENLGGEFEESFRKFSANYNPQNIKKHLEDAFEFCRFLLAQPISGISKNFVKFEKTKLEFFGYGKRFAFCRLDYDFRQYFKEKTIENPRKKTSIAVWLKVGKNTKHFFIR